MQARVARTMGRTEGLEGRYLLRFPAKQPTALAAVLQDQRPGAAGTALSPGERQEKATVIFLVQAPGGVLLRVFPRSRGALPTVSGP